MNILRNSLRIGFFSLAMAGIVLAPSAPAIAQTKQVRLASGPAAVSVVHRTSQTLRTDQSFTDIVVGDPDIADAVPLTDKSIYVLGKKVGVTSVSVYDADKKLVGVIEVDVTQNAPRAAQEIRRNGDGQVRVGTEAGKIVLNGKAKDAVAADRAARIARSHGGEVVNQMRVQGPQQVMLEVRFIEISRQAGRDLGVRLQASGSDGAARSGRGQVGILGFASSASALASGGASAPFGTILTNLVRNGTNIDVLIQALEEQGVARRLAEPNLVTMSGEKASFLAGGEIPIPVAQQAGQISIDFKKFGVGLTFTPTVLAGSMINLRIEPEVSQIDPTTESFRVGSIVIPRLIVSRASTVVELKSGQSFAIAGLLQSTNTVLTEQLPWIGEIPVVGTLFRSKSFQQKETELAIIVTPHLVQPVRPGQKLRSPLDNTRPPTDAEVFVGGRSEVPSDGYRRQGPVDPVAANHRSAGGGHILDLTGATSNGR
ncbi:MAG: type II and III secretion system protein family protein [Beijerinckiaceae bacterium]